MLSSPDVEWHDWTFPSIDQDCQARERGRGCHWPIGLEWPACARQCSHRCLACSDLRRVRWGNRRSPYGRKQRRTPRDTPRSRHELKASGFDVRREKNRRTVYFRDGYFVGWIVSPMFLAEWRLESLDSAGLSSSRSSVDGIDWERRNHPEHACSRRRHAWPVTSPNWDHCKQWRCAAESRLRRF